MPNTLIAIVARLRDDADELSFGPPVHTVYNPLRYAWKPHRRYLERFGVKRGRVVLMGMNPGPWGMAQTGVPFGEVASVREWMQIEADVGKPLEEHPKRPIQGFACPRSEVSGRRLWTWAADRFGSADSFFDQFFVINYCPLAFLEASGRNRTPDKLPAAERRPLLTLCDRALQEALAALEPRLVVGVGRFAEARARDALQDAAIPVGGILHPSPASPAANRGWDERADEQLRALGLELN